MKSEAVNRSMTDNTMVNRKKSQSMTYKILNYTNPTKSSLPQVDKQICTPKSNNFLIRITKI